MKISFIKPQPFVATAYIRAHRFTVRKLALVPIALTMVATVFGAVVYLTGSSTAFNDAVYPLKVSTDNKSLVGQDGRPYFYTGDTSWTMLSTLSRTEASQYMDARKAQGFNTIQTIMVNWNRAYSKAGVTAFTNNDISKPNDAYFATIDEIVQDAATRNMQLIIDPLWLADNASGTTNGLPTVAQWQAFGTYVGTRYQSYPNIMWMVGGDHDPINTWGNDSGFNYGPYVDAMATAIKAQDTTHLMTYHPATDTRSLASKPWLDFYSVQRNLANSAPWAYSLIKDFQNTTPVKPVLNIEPAYETKDAMSNTVTTPYQVRRNAWWIQLAGSMGLAYGGSSNTWNIVAGGWQNFVDLPGAKQTGYIRQILEPFAWEKLVPDWNHAAVTSGYGTYGNNDYVTAGKTADGSLLVAYTPNSRTLTVNMSTLAGTTQAYWIDPSTTTSTSIGSFANSGSRTFTTPTANAAGDKDFVLLLTSTPPTPDTTAPEVSITQPLSGSTATDTVTLSAAASDAESPVRVQFKLDGANIGGVLSSPFTLSWNSATVANGLHTLTVVATNNAGLTTTSAEVQIDVQNVPPTPPTVALATPTAGATVAGTQTVSANASDTKAVTSVQFKLNGNNLGSADTTAPYGISWDTTAVANGAYSLTAVATNTSGLTTTSSAVSVTVANVVATNGLTAKYYNNINLTGTPVVTRLDSTVNFNWANSPASGVNSNNFSVRWTGQLKVPTTGSYTIGFNGDDGYRVYVNSTLLVNSWKDQSATYKTGVMSLTGGRNYPITVEFYDKAEEGIAQLYWTGPGITKRIIPTANLLAQ